MEMNLIAGSIQNFETKPEKLHDAPQGAKRQILHRFPV